ncbi:MAG: OmpH family outer membrane protein [Bacteroidetes bacterium]|nr:OmpH family outer membrane protein [Bacteroidota bacterium]
MDLLTSNLNKMQNIINKFSLSKESKITKYFSKFFLLLLFLVFVGISPINSVPKNYDIRVVNEDAIFSSIPKFELERNKLKAEAERLTKEFQEKAKNFEQRAKRFQESAERLNPSQREKETKELMKLRNTLGQEQMEITQKLNSKNMDLIAKYDKKIDEAVRKYGKSLGVSIFFIYGNRGTRVICLNNEYDCTNQILLKMKSKL